MGRRVEETDFKGVLANALMRSDVSGIVLVMRLKDGSIEAWNSGVAPLKVLGMLEAAKMLIWHNAEHDYDDEEDNDAGEAEGGS